MADLVIKKNENLSPGEWPVSATIGEQEFYFSESFLPEKLNYELVKSRAARYLNLVLLAVGGFGVLALVLHFISPVGQVWLRVFFFTLLTNLWLWTRMLEADQVKSADLKFLFTPTALKALRLAILNRGQKQASALHLFLTLLAEKDAQNIFYRLGLGFRVLATSTSPQLANAPVSPPALSDDFAKIPFLAYAAMLELKVKKLSPQVLLAGLAKLPEGSPVNEVLADQKITPAMLYQAVRWQVTVGQLIVQRRQTRTLLGLRPKSDINRGLTAVPTPVLNKFSTDLTLRAQMGRLPYVFGRESELQNIFSGFGSAGGLMLVGEPGVGKTSILEILAERMLTEDVPEAFSDKRLVRLDLAKLLSQGENAGQALTAAVNEALHSGNIVLVAENIHEWTEARSHGVPLFSILTSALTESGLPLITTTTSQSFEQTPVLQSSSFTRLDIPEMSTEDVVLTAAIHASLTESIFPIFWTMEAVEKAVELSSKYVHQSTQPEKSVKVVETLSERLGAHKDKQVKLVSPADVEHIISEMAHVDAEEVSEDEAEKLLNLESELSKRVIGQVAAVKAVAAAMRRVKANLTAAKPHPLASLLFLGPTGVGKTELAKALADIEFSAQGGSTSGGGEDLIIRLDMTEYNLAESVEKLLGGRTFSSSFAAKVRERPYSVILLDEFEKAHSEIQNLMLQALDEGHLTDNAGSKLDLTNTIIIATSNAAAAEIKQGFESGKDAQSLQEHLAHNVLTNYFKPELINRFDGVILFKPLDTADMVKIVKLQLQKIADKLKEQGIALELSEDGILQIAKASQDAQFGARTLARYLQEHIENPVADWILSQQLKRKDTVVITADGSPQIKQAA